MTTQPNNPVSSSERAALRSAIAARDAAKEKVEVASKSAERGKQLLREAQHKLELFGDVDGAILKHRAASFKSAAQGGPKPSLALPNDLVRRERARDEAAASVSAAKAAHGILVGEFAEAQSALQKAEARVSEIAGHVLAAEAAERGASLVDIWNDIWVTVDSLNALHSALRVKLPAEIMAAIQFFATMDHRQFPGGRNELLARAFQQWRSYHAALCKSADASGAELIGDLCSVADRAA